MIANLLSREEDKLTALEVMEKLLVNRERDPDALVAYALLAIRAEDMARSDAAMNRTSFRNPTNQFGPTISANMLCVPGDVEAAITGLRPIEGPDSDWP